MLDRQKKEGEHEKYVKDPNDTSAHQFGDLELNRSGGDPELRFTKILTPVGKLDASLVGQQVIIRGRKHNDRA